MSIQHLTARLQAAFPKYKTMNPHTLRRDVSALVDFAGRMQRLSDLRADLSGGLSFDEAVATAQRKALDQKQVKVRKTLLRIYQHQKLSNK